MLGLQCSAPRSELKFSNVYRKEAATANLKSTITSSSVIISIEANERTPLLADQNKKRKSYGNKQYVRPTKEPSSSTSRKNMICNYEEPWFHNFRLVAFCLAVISSILIAIYLLIIQTRLPSIGFSLDLVSRDIWSKLSMPLGSLLNHSNVVNIMIGHTGGKSCSNPDSCTQILKEMQNKVNVIKSEIPYNFLIGGDGITYEVRGWDYESGYASVPQNSTLVIGLIGSYTNTAPSPLQLQSAYSLIKESIRRKKLQRQYQIYGIRNLTISETDGEALFRHTAKWPRFDTLLHIN
ncbi:peptidoglycan-recognition protein 3-like [Teleopsis dalmanni]|uniref:peptidoglycan-recognition protein 3-like n=1 Tax=Teleopsis dalmanni TaxID=139649 RepID=UPI0018CF0103|nr:peptidoglycan-recognition protein 3-like [Teleopsis dalmanni]